MDNDQTTGTPAPDLTPPETEETPADQLPDVPEEADEIEEQPEGERYDGGEIPESPSVPEE